MASGLTPKRFQNLPKQYQHCLRAGIQIRSEGGADVAANSDPNTGLWGNEYSQSVVGMQTCGTCMETDLAIFSKNLWVSWFSGATFRVSRQSAEDSGWVQIVWLEVIRCSAAAPYSKVKKQLKYIAGDWVNHDRAEVNLYTGLNFKNK